MYRQRKRQFSSNSSGFIISGRRILTNAHCVDHATAVKVKRRGSYVKHMATVLAVGTECDIALLTVEDDAFWQDAVPVEFGSLPQLQVRVGADAQQGGAWARGAAPPCWRLGCSAGGSGAAGLAQHCCPNGAAVLGCRCRCRFCHARLQLPVAVHS